jgi:nucleotide-binding universal stress UspA family protein
VPVDFSPESSAALRYAMTLATHETAIDVVHVWDLPSYVGGGFVDTRLTGDAKAPRYAAQFVHDIAADRMAELLWPWRDDPRVTGKILDGNAATVLADLSKHCDLVVIGRRSEGARELLLGSVAAKVIAAASCPVLTVHERRDSHAA